MTDQDRTDCSLPLPDAPAGLYALRGLFLLAVGFTLHTAAPLLTPIAIAVLLSLLLSPVVRGLSRRGVPASATAAVLVISLVVAAGSFMAWLSAPAEQWLAEVPKTVRELREHLSDLGGPLDDLQRVTNEVDTLTTALGDEEKKKPVSVEFASPTMVEGLLGSAPQALASIGVVVFLTFFLSAAGETLLRRVTRLGRTWSERRRIVCVIRGIQSDISVHLRTITIINVTLGLITAGLMYLLGIPNPMLWGAMVALFNFAPYLGAAMSTVVLTLVGVSTFDTLQQALVVPGVFVALTTLEGQLITPAVLGQRLALSPTVVFLSVVLWGWLWGITGALIAVPMTAAIKVILDYWPGMGRIAELLGKEEDRPARPSSPAREPESAAVTPTPRPVQ